MSEITSDLTTRNTLQYVQYAQTYYAGVQQSVVSNTAMVGGEDEKVAFVSAQSLLNRTNDLVATKEALDRTLGATGTAIQALSNMDATINEMKSVVESARNATSASERGVLQERYEELAGQLDEYASQASYDGVNLLKEAAEKTEAAEGATTGIGSETVVVRNRPVDAASLGVTGTAANAGGQPLSEGAARIVADWSAPLEGEAGGSAGAAEEAFAAIGAGLDAAASEVRETANYFSTQRSALQSYDGAVVPLSGSDTGQTANLVLPDSSQVRASLVAMQTREQLGDQTLSIMGMQQIGLLGMIR
ncbi:MAG: hypothetical protein LLG06_18880 [Desulfobacteraceae bacterium]|nr:hypothetical protein [Desulfobacteraceae bacterium]